MHENPRTVDFLAVIRLAALLAVGCGPSGGVPFEGAPESGTGSTDGTGDARAGDTGEASDAGPDAAIANPGDAAPGNHDAGEGGAGDSGAGDAGKGEGPLPNGLMAFPPPNGVSVCPDPPLRITFPGPPTLGTSGKIRVLDSAGVLAASVDMGATSFSDVIGGTTFNTVRPVYVDGNGAVVYLKSHALAYGTTYHVNVDPGAIVGPGGTALAIGDATSWRFTTAAAPPPLSSLAVALDGTAPFCSVQGAIDALPAGNTVGTTIAVRTGVYHEIVHFASKDNITLRGADRKATIIEGMNNNTMNPSTAARSLVGVDSSSGLVIDTMTIRNLTPQGGSQAEALRLQSCDKCEVRNADISSLQDTLLWSGRIYAAGCTIAGNVDFVWGTGTAYFDKCELHTVGRAGWNVQARNPASKYGYVFVDSTLTADPGVTGQGLGRIDDGVYPASQVAYINCTMGNHIAPQGWTITGGAGTSQLRLWEYQSVDPSGAPVDVSHRAAGSTQIDAATAQSMRDPTVVFAGWQPP